MRLLLLCLVPCLVAADTWVKFVSGPIEILSDAGERPARETMVRFQQFRHALGQIVGEPDLQTPQPVRIVLFKNAKGWTTAKPIVEGRDRYTIVLQEKAPVTPDTWRELAHLFLKSNTAQMPPAFEHGLVEFFSTFEVNGIRITAGTPPAKPDLDWARIHLLIVDPDYFGKIRVLLYNLRKGVDPEPAFRNAFGKSPAEVEAHARQHLAAGNFQTTPLSSRPMAESDFQVRPVSDADARLARADVLAGGLSVAEYQSLLRDRVKVAEAEEGLGLLAVRDRANDEARKHFAAAIEAGSTSARAHIEYAKLESDPEKANQALLKAAGINPKLEEPFVLMAQRDTDPRKRVMHWKAAVERNPRNLTSWKALAECYLTEHKYGEAAKAWKEAEQAAVDPALRAEMHRSRMAIEQQRLDYEAEQKRREKEEEAREIEALKDKARAEVRAAEAKANAGSTKPEGPVVQWGDFARPEGKAAGTLTRIDCLGKLARLTVQGSNGAVTKLVIVDPAKIAISGGGDATLGCGVQKPRRVIIEYVPKGDAKLGTAGEVATIEFQ